MNQKEVEIYIEIMELKVKINDYITIYSEKEKIFIYIQETRFQELDDSLINKILRRFKSQLKKPIIQGNYYKNIDKKDSKNSDFNNFVNIMKLWIQNNYDTSILQYDISFPLLKRLVEVGDSNAQKVFINEILKNLWEGDPLVVKYLFNEKYDEYVVLDNYRKQIHNPNIKKIKLTLLICFINILIYILFNEIFHLSDFFVFDSQKIINNLEVWRVFSAIFMHLDRFSLFINTFFLCCVGSYFEVNNFFPRSTYLIIYIISGLVGNLGYLVITSQFPAYILSSGASGAIFGLAGAFIIILIIKKKYIWLIIYLAICTFFYINTINPRINFISHLIGYITGIICYLFYQLTHKHNIIFRSSNI